MNGPGDIIQQRIASATIVEAGGLTAPQAAEIFNRLGTLEGRVAAINPLPPQPDHLISTLTHGLAGTRMTMTMYAGQVLWTPMFIPYGFSTRHLSIWVDVARTDAGLNLGIYDNTGALYVEMGTVSASTPGFKTITRDLNYPIPAGTSWLAVHASHADIGIAGMTDGRAMFHWNNGFGAARSWSGSHPFGSLPPNMTVDWVSDSLPLVMMDVMT